MELYFISNVIACQFWQQVLIYMNWCIWNLISRAFFNMAYFTKTILATLTIVHLSWCWSRFKDYIPNGNKVPNPCSTDPSSMWSAVGHLSPGNGGPRNPFGKVSTVIKVALDLCIIWLTFTIWRVRSPARLLTWFPWLLPAVFES